MKKVILSFSIMVAMATTSSAQVFDLRLDLGYGFPSGTSYMQVNDGSTTKDVPFSFGSGFNMGISGSAWFGDHIGAGLDLNYLIGSVYTFTNSAPQAFGSVQTTDNWSGSMFAITPMLLLSAHSDGINPYGRLGLVIGVPTITDNQTQAGNSAAAGTNTDVYSGGMAVGLYAAFGVEIPLTDNLLLAPELFDRTMNYTPTQVENTQAYDNQTKYPTTTLVTSLANNSTASNTMLAPYRFPFSSWGIKVGLIYRLGK